MPFPDTLDTAQVSGQIAGYTDLPAAATFSSSGWLIGDVFVPPFVVTADIAEDGSFTVELPWTENAGWTPQGRTYDVRLDHGFQVQRGTLAVPEGTVTMDLQEAFNPDATPESGSTYSLLGHSHDTGDVDDLQTLLDAKLDVPVEPYITADDIANLVSYETLQEELALKANKAGPTLTGTVTLGSKNTATGLAFAGYLDIATAPTTGAWLVGDVVRTRIGPFRCTVAGTPGTWVPMWREQVLDRGYVAWNGDPGASVQAGTIVPVSGRSYIFRLRAFGPLISLIHMHTSTTSVGVTQAWCTLHDDNGLILNASAKSNANQATAFQTGGMKAFTFVAPQVVTPGAYYRARVWFATGTSLPTISRMCNSSTDIINPDVTGTAASTPYGWASADSGLTDLASAPDQIGNLSR